MPDDHAPTPPDSRPAPLDTNLIPLGERAWQAILRHVLAVGDEAETTYLEVKSDVDPTTKIGVTKVAKFLLGAANRLPQQAARHFHGHAVLVIGAEQGKARGVSRGVEPHDLEDSLRPYLGSQFPAFEFGRITVNDDREVLFIVAPPPQDGQSIFPCHKEFQGEKSRDNLADGAIYVRGASNSRPARAGEVLNLVERARGGGKPPIDLDVQVLGMVNRVESVNEVLQILYHHEEEEFSRPRKAAKEPLGSPFVAQLPGRARPLSNEERAKRLEVWKRNLSQNLAKGREHFLGAALPGAGIRVVSHDRSISKPELIVTFHDCEAFSHRDADDVKWEKVIEPVVRPQSPYGISGFDPDDLHIVRRGYPVAWDNRGNHVEVTLTPELFRPNTPWASNQDDYVIVARDRDASSVSVTWTLTEDSNDEVTKGEFEASTGDIADARYLFKKLFLKDE